MKVTSRVRHEDKYKCVLLCIEKEKEGYQCVRPIKRVSHYHKEFRRNGRFFEYVGGLGDTYYEAIYQKEVMRH